MQVYCFLQVESHINGNWYRVQELVCNKLLLIISKEIFKPLSKLTLGFQSRSPFALLISIYYLITWPGLSSTSFMFESKFFPHKLKVLLANSITEISSSPAMLIVCPLTSFCIMAIVASITSSMKIKSSELIHIETGGNI